MTDPHRPDYPRPVTGPRAGFLADPGRRRLLLIAGLALLGLLLVLAIWNSSGSRAARGDLRAANERVLEKRREVTEARQVLEQRLAELREAEAAVVAEDERLDTELVRERRSSVSGGDVEPLSDDERRARESLREAEAALRDDRRRRDP